MTLRTASISWACAGRLYPSHGPALKAQESIRLLVFNLQSHGVMVLKVRRETALKGRESCRNIHALRSKEKKRSDLAHDVDNFRRSQQKAGGV